MRSASPALAQALASQASQLSAQGTVGRTASRLRNVSMHVPDRYQYIALSLPFSQAAMPSLHVSMCLHQADGCPLITPLSRRGMVVHAMQGATGRDAS